jgi:hypothetical protein
MDASRVPERRTDGRNWSAGQFLDRECLHLICDSDFDLDTEQGLILVKSGVN